MNNAGEAATPMSAKSRQPLPSIGVDKSSSSSGQKVKKLEENSNSNRSSGLAVVRRKKSVPSEENQLAANADKASSADSSIKSSKSGKKPHHEWNRYFAFINDKQREKLMQLPDNTTTTRKKGARTRGGKTKRPEANVEVRRSKSAKVESRYGQVEMNTRRKNSMDTETTTKGERRARGVSRAKSAEMLTTTTKTSTPKTTEDDENNREQADDSELEEKRRVRRMQRTRPSLLGTYNFNTDLDKRDNNKMSSSSNNNNNNNNNRSREAAGAYGYDYFRSETNHRVQCRPQLMDEFDDRFTLADEFRTLKFRTTQNNLMRSMRSNLVSFSKMRDMHEKFLRCNQNYLA